MADVKFDLLVKINKLKEEVCFLRKTLNSVSEDLGNYDFESEKDLDSISEIVNKIEKSLNEGSEY